MSLETLENNGNLSLDICQARLARWAFDGHLPYGVYPEEVVEGLNVQTADYFSSPVALSHFFTEGKRGNLLRMTFPKEDVIQGDFEGFELMDEDLHMPVGIKMNVDLVPGSNPGIRREELMPLWNEETKSLKVPNFDYRRTSGSIWRKILESKIQIRF